MAESEEGKIPLNIVLLPDTAVKNWAITHSYRVTRHFPGEFNLDGDLHKAHLSLVHGEYPQSAIGTLATLLEGIYNSPGFYLDLPLIKGSAEGLQEMISTGHDVWICTAPSSSNPTCIQDKFDWLNRHFGSALSSFLQ
jgi:hypothetical protein